MRDPGSEKIARLLDSIKGDVSVVTIDQFDPDCDVVLVAIPGAVVPETLARYGKALDGKIIIDASNQINQPVMHSLEQIREHATGAKLVRAFSNLGWEVFAEPVIGGIQADLFYCGEAGEAQQIVHRLIEEIGLRAIYLGDLNQAPLIDALTRLWFAMAIRDGRGRHLAFKMLND